MELLLLYATVGSVALLAAMSPGPDFLVVSKNSLVYSRKAGVFTALGVGFAILVHVGYTLIGIGLVISQSIVLFSLIKILGAVYLVYLGTKLLVAKEEDTQPAYAQDSFSKKTTTQAFKEGFLTNVLNPKATVFFVSIFSQFISPELSVFAQTLLGLEVAIIVALWFVVLALILTVSSVKSAFARFQNRMLKIMGVALIALGVKVAISR